MPADDPRLAAWAARHGVDLMGTQYQAPGSHANYYALKPLGLRAWEISDEQCQHMLGYLAGQTLKLDRPVDGLLAHFDKASGTFQPEKTCAFLFVTREGTCGTLQIGSQENMPNIIGAPKAGNLRPGLGLSISYRYFYSTDDRPESTTSNQE